MKTKTKHSPIKRIEQTKSYARYLTASFLLFLSLFLNHCFSQCSSPFPPRNHIDKFRILAIKAEPPEIAPGESTQISFLAVHPQKDIAKGTFPSFPTCLSKSNTDSAFWIACLPALGPYSKGSDFACAGLASTLGNPSDAGEVDAGSPPQVKPCNTLQFDGKTSQVCVPIPPCGESITWQAPSSFLQALPEKERQVGADVMLLLNVQQGTQKQTSLKRIRVSQKPKAQRNTNPQIQDILLDGEPVSSCLPDQAQQCETLTISADKNLKIRVSLAPNTQDPIPTSKDPNRREDIQIFWFATAGEFDVGSTIHSGANPPAHSIWPTWFPNDHEGTPLRAHTILRIVALAQDRRGGFDWKQIILKLTPP